MPDNDIPQVPQPDDAVVGKEAGAQMLATACAARDAFYASLGAMDADVLAPLVNPAFMGGPRWPSLRQAWRVIRRADSILIASDGLSDPFEDDDDVFVPRGHLLEVCIEAPLAAFDGDSVQAAWLFDVIYQVSQNVADHGSIDLLLQRPAASRWRWTCSMRQQASKTKTNRWACCWSRAQPRFPRLSTRHMAR